MPTRDEEVDWDTAAEVEAAPEVSEQEQAKFLDSLGELAGVPLVEAQDMGRPELVLGEPTEFEIAAAKALLARAGRKVIDAVATQVLLRDPNAPVSDKPIPIMLAEPDTPNMRVIDAGGMQIISTPDRIQVVERAIGRGAEPEVAAPPRDQPERIVNKTAAEQMMGRRALGVHEERAAMFPKARPTPAEMKRDALPTPVISAGAHPLQHLLSRPAPAPNKGAGY